MTDPAFLLALVAALLGAASMVLHVVAPRTKNTIDDALRDDIDEVLVFIRGQQPNKRPAGPPTGTLPLLALVVLGLGASQLGCGGSQSSRAATINSLYSGLNAAAQALRTYEGVEADAVVARVKASTETVDQARADLIALRAKVHPVEVARDAAYSAIDVALTVNDDPSLAGAQLALNRAIAAITALTGGSK